MGRRGRPTVEITLTAPERDTLERWARRHRSSQALSLRCQIVLACAAGATNAQVAEELRCHPVTVSKWRTRFATDRLDGLVDVPRPGAQRTIGDDVIEQVVVDTLGSAPGADTHWSTRGLAAKHGISHQTVAEIWRAFGLKPWTQDGFKVSPDPDLVEKIRDLVGLYMNPPVNAAVFAVDEKPQIQALNRTVPILPMLSTTPQRASHDYQRNGTCDLFAALEIATGRVITDIRARHTSVDFVAFLEKINRDVRPVRIAGSDVRVGTRDGRVRRGRVLTGCCVRCSHGSLGQHRKRLPGRGCGAQARCRVVRDSEYRTSRLGRSWLRRRGQAPRRSPHECFFELQRSAGRDCARPGHLRP